MHLKRLLLLLTAAGLLQASLAAAELRDCASFVAPSKVEQTDCSLAGIDGRGQTGAPLAPADDSTPKPHPANTLVSRVAPPASVPSTLALSEHPHSFVPVFLITRRLRI